LWGGADFQVVKRDHWSSAALIREIFREASNAVPADSRGRLIQRGSMPDVEFRGPCPFCGEFIEESELDPCSVTVTTKTGLWQVWYCHGRCFKGLVVENPHLDLSPAHL
jgi:hypothetical protein